MNPAAPTMEMLLRQFFSAPNVISLDRIEQGEEDQKAGRFRRWIAPLRLPEPVATLLPCMRTPGQVDWYAVAFSDREMRTLREELSAFVGPSYSYFRGERAHLDPDDPVEAAVLQMTAGRPFRVSAPVGSKPQTELWNVLERMRSVRARRNERDSEALRPAGRVLRDFFFALRAGSREGAEDLLRLLREQYQFGTWNLLFLRVQMLSDLGRWEELLALPQMADLLRIRRPLAVTEALLTAVYHRELESFELRDDPLGAAEHFAREIFPRYAPLFAYRTGMRSPEVLKSFLLLAVSAERPDFELRDDILRVARLPVSQQRYLQRLGDLVPERQSMPSAPTIEPLARAREAREQGLYDEVYALSAEAPASLERARLLLQSAYEIPALEVRSTAIVAVESLTDDERGQLLSSRWAQDFWADLAGPAEEAPTAALPSGWIEWLERLGGTRDIGHAVEVARLGASEWTIEALLDAPGSVRALADALMGGRGADEEAAIRDALPHLLFYVQKDPVWPRRDLLPLYHALLLLLASTDRGGRDELDLFNEVLSALLSLGVSIEGYRDLVNTGIALWETFPARKNLDWVLDLLDLLASYPCPDEEVRLRLLQMVVGSLQQFAAKGYALEPQHRLIIRTRCQELGHPELLAAYPDTGPKWAARDDVEETPVFEDLRGRRVALYTLTESAGQRAAALLKELCPGVTVDVNHDKVCTQRLRAAAQNADIFVMATASAKHAATGCIEGNRSKELPLLRPSGKGCSSMLSALALYLSGA